MRRRTAVAAGVLPPDEGLGQVMGLQLAAVWGALLHLEAQIEAPRVEEP